MSTITIIGLVLACILVYLLMGVWYVLGIELTFAGGLLYIKTPRAFIGQFYEVKEKRVIVTDLKTGKQVFVEDTTTRTI